VEGAFVQGMGWLTTEELWWNAGGKLMTHAPSTYKIPSVSDWPEHANVALLAASPNREQTIYRSKAVGEPPLMLAISVFHAIRDACALPQVVVNDDAHAAEHALEVQLPFLQAVLDSFTLVPLAVGRATPDDVAAVLDVLWGGPETLIVVSSDLSHYHAYGEAQHIDRKTADAILKALSDSDAAQGRTTAVHLHPSWRDR